MPTLAEMLRQGSWENPNNPYSSNLLSDALRGSLSNAESLGRGAAVAPLGIFGDVNALAREYITPRLPSKVQAALESLPAAPTTEAILAKIPRGTEARRESSGMEQLGAAMNPMGPIEAAKGVTKGLGAYGKLAGEAINDAMVYGRGPLAQVTPQPMRMVEDFSYRSSHTAPGPDFGAPLHDLTGGGQMYPADVYSPQAAQYYGGSVPYDAKAFSIAQSYKDKPNASVTIYRAVPKETSNSEKLAEIEKQMAAYMKRGTLPKDTFTDNGSKWYDWAYDQREKLRNLPDEPIQGINDINSGDWVTLTKEYAKDHGESALKGQYKILSKKVKAKDLWTNADSIHEFGYQPQDSNLGAYK